NSQSPYPSLAAGGCHTAASTSISGARTRCKGQKAAKERKLCRLSKAVLKTKIESAQSSTISIAPAALECAVKAAM
ncbi:MAG: hypothetical protein ACI4L8_04795, partial [Candidatus Fimadaptatus sp.]